jgi:RNA polymerase sigma-70 factor (ECF subfamily)
LSAEHLNTVPETWQRLAAGDEQAFRTLFHSFTPSLFASALQVVKLEEPAREIVQETFLKVWMHREALGLMDNPAGWVFRAASNLSISYLRKQASAWKWLQQQPFSSEAANDVLEKVSFREAQQLLHQAIAALPPKRQLIFRLSRQEELNHAEIAARLNMSQNTVKNQIVLAVKFIEHYIQQHLGVLIPLFLLTEIFF